MSLSRPPERLTIAISSAEMAKHAKTVGNAIRLMRDRLAQPWNHPDRSWADIDWDVLPDEVNAVIDERLDERACDDCW